MAQHKEHSQSPKATGKISKKRKSKNAGGKHKGDSVGRRPGAVKHTEVEVQSSVLDPSIGGSGALIQKSEAEPSSKHEAPSSIPNPSATEIDPKAAAPQATEPSPVVESASDSSAAAHGIKLCPSCVRSLQQSGYEFFTAELSNPDGTTNTVSVPVATLQPNDKAECMNNACAPENTADPAPPSATELSSIPVQNASGIGSTVPVVESPSVGGAEPSHGVHFCQSCIQAYQEQGLEEFDCEETLPDGTIHDIYVHIRDIKPVDEAECLNEDCVAAASWSATEDSAVAVSSAETKSPGISAPVNALTAWASFAASSTATAKISAASRVTSGTMRIMQFVTPQRPARSKAWSNAQNHRREHPSVYKADAVAQSRLRRRMRENKDAVVRRLARQIPTPERFDKNSPPGPSEAQLRRLHRRLEDPSDQVYSIAQRINGKTFKRMVKALKDNPFSEPEIDSDDDEFA
ncbi:hypothetical protein LTR56_015485 [Elasticomyces elasticus]|nr:hypothetical protein LTR56_015485 [Elasticomyces elasticus]KAK3662518.1 hypothetical protein LTR22_006584 [Elasticomyces elasticus]KAK4927862.1 hypothetical protein LTR49_005284 [Elasticomyces elasticus]KAK5750209.1 hypothetical protein LTS12_019698 [Elasticomyces elasticus]